jgi:PAS domain S-box-containing protein
MSDPHHDQPFASSLAHHASDPFRLLVESVRDYAIFMVDPAGMIASWNPGAELMKGYAAEEILGAHFSCFYTDADVAEGRPQENLAAARRDGRYEEEGERVRKDGTVFWAIVTITALNDHFGQHVGFAKVIRDITSRKAAEDAIRASEERYHRLLDMMPEAIFVNQDGRIVYCNAAFASLIGVAGVEAVVGRPTLDFFPERWHTAIQGRIETTTRDGHVPLLEREVIRQDGTTVAVDVSATRIRYEARDAILVSLHDLTTRRQSEEASFKLASIIEESDDAIIGKNLDGVITSWNAGAERLYGYSAEEALGQHITLIIPTQLQDQYERIMATIAQGKRVAPFETVRRRKDGTMIDVSVSVSPVRNPAGTVLAASSIAQDITAKKRLQEQFRQAQKMEAIGRLAGGVAHDFNNLLTIISGYSDVLLATLPPTDESRPMILEIRSAGERAASLTRQLLTFSRQQLLAPRVLDVNAIVAGSEKLLSRLLGEDIDVRSTLAAEFGRVRADPGQLEQVIVNLSINARDAMPRGGKLTIETADVELDETYCRMHPHVTPGPFVLLAVSDTGSGMDETTKSQIFEPFFTTKEQGKGTGLGLSMVYGFITHSSGHIDVYSEPGLGSTFKVYLPRVEDTLTTAKGGTAQADMPTGQETVLVVEDEEAVRRLACHVLESCGYRVLEASHGEGAIAVAGGHAGPIHLLVTDVVMPGLGGRVVAERVAGLKPGIKVLFMSGYTDDAVVRHGVLAAEMAFLQKPFSPSSLARKVRAVLDGEGWTVSADR